MHRLSRFACVETSGVLGALRFVEGRQKAMRAGPVRGDFGGRYTTTTEVYPDSPRATPEQCIAAQVAAVCAGVEFVVAGR